MRATLTPYRARALVFLLPLLLLTLARCGGSDSGTAPTSRPPVQHQLEVQQAIDELEGQVGFRPVAPTYLPDGIDPAPETAHVRNETQQTAIISFFPLDENPAGTTLNVLELTEDPVGDAQCPLCPSEGFTTLELSGEQALAEEGVLPEEDLVYYVLHFIAGDLLVILNAEWVIPAGTDMSGPTVDMKQEVARVAESILSQD